MQLRPRPISNRAALAALALLVPAIALAQITVTPIGPAIPIRPQPIGQPDLTVTNLVFTCPTTSACGTPRVQVGCPNSCNSTVTVTNLGNAPVPANTTHVRWITNGVYGAPTSQDQTIGVVIPAGGSVPVTRPWFFGPCTQCGGSQPASFTVIVDPQGTVNETNETNNTITTPACQVCTGGV